MVRNGRRFLLYPIVKNACSKPRINALTPSRLNLIRLDCNWSVGANWIGGSVAQKTTGCHWRYGARAGDLVMLAPHYWFRCNSTFRPSQCSSYRAGSIFCNDGYLLGHLRYTGIKTVPAQIASPHL